MYCSEVFFKKNISSSSLCCAGLMIIILVSSIRSTPNVLQYILNIYICIARTKNVFSKKLFFDNRLNSVRLGNKLHFSKLPCSDSTSEFMYIIQLIHRHLSFRQGTIHFILYTVFLIISQVKILTESSLIVHHRLFCTFPIFNHYILSLREKNFCKKFMNVCCSLYRLFSF